MISFRFTVVAIALLGLLSAGSLAQPPEGHSRRNPLPHIPSAGSEAFRGLLHFHKVVPVRPEELTENDYANLIVIVLGRPSQGMIDPSRYTQRALRAGGAVLVAIDEQYPLANYFPTPTDVLITGEGVFCLDQASQYAGLSNCPYVVPRKPGDIDKLMWQVTAPDTEWGLFFGIEKLATNIPSALVVRSESQYVRVKLAGYPATARAVSQKRGRIAEDLESDRLFAVAGAGREDRPFRSLILADPSVFSNQMMAPPSRFPNQNFAFANRVVQWLRGPTERTKCLFIENGRVETKFDLVRYEALQSMPPIPVPPMPDLLNPELQSKLTDGINSKIADLQDRNVLNRRLANDDWRLNQTVRFLAGIAAVALLVLIIRRVWRGRHEPDLPPVPTDTGHVTGNAPPGSIARRREEILQTGDYGEEVREYLQEMFASRGLPLPVPKPRSKMPPIQIKGPGSTTLREHLRILWDVAFSPQPQSVSYPRWKELEPMIDAVRRAAEDGRWRFADTGDAA